MPTPRKAGRFGGSAAHHKHIVANLATELLRHGRIQTTHAKAKTVQPTADRLITFAKRGDLHSRRQARKIVRDPDVLHHLFAEVGPAFTDRDGGYTRVLKLGPRKGDAAPMALVELVDAVAPAPGADDDEPRRRWSLRRRSGEAAAPSDDVEAPAPEADESAAAASPEDTDSDEERPEVDPAEVEARFAAEEAAGEADAEQGADDSQDADAAADAEDTDTTEAADDADTAEAADDADTAEAADDADTRTAEAADDADADADAEADDEQEGRS